MLFINGRNSRDGLWKKNVNRFCHRQIFIEGIRKTNRTVKSTSSTPCAKISFHISRGAAKGDPKVPCLSFHCLDFGIGQNIDIGMSTDIRHLGAEYSNGTVHRRKRLVQLGHFAPDCGRLLDQVDLESQRSQVQRGLNATDPSP